MNEESSNRENPVVTDRRHRSKNGSSRWLLSPTAVARGGSRILVVSPFFLIRQQIMRREEEWQSITGELLLGRCSDLDERMKQQQGQKMNEESSNWEDPVVTDRRHQSKNGSSRWLLSPTAVARGGSRLLVVSPFF
ncbi:unnamed protein product [Lactuca virosa]|uniref:Uncharacterized protein n=1 Tax=Lactuca virosa TaxID=75947 RepID=A0AAU9P0D8_9ASTR|nr:unnamed protein product [Lactuca virosa]